MNIDKIDKIDKEYDFKFELKSITDISKAIFDYLHNEYDTNGEYTGDIHLTCHLKNDSLMEDFETMINLHPEYIDKFQESLDLKKEESFYKMFKNKVNDLLATYHIIYDDKENVMYSTDHYTLKISDKSHPVMFTIGLKLKYDKKDNTYSEYIVCKHYGFSCDLPKPVRVDSNYVPIPENIERSIYKFFSIRSCFTNMLSDDKDPYKFTASHLEDMILLAMNNNI